MEGWSTTDLAREDPKRILKGTLTKDKGIHVYRSSMRKDCIIAHNKSGSSCRVNYGKGY